MSRFRLIATACLVATVLVGHAATVAQETESKAQDLPSGLEVLQRYTKVTGGADNYKAIKTLTTEAMLSIPQMDIGGTIDMAMAPGGKMQFVVEIDGVGKQVMGSDGKHVWAIAGITGARLLEGDEANQLRGRAELTRYYAPKEVFSKIENRGVVDVDGKPAYEVEVTRKSGAEETEYYDVESGLLVKSKIMAMVHGAGELEITTLSEKYTEVGKLKFPFRQVQILPGGNEQVVEFVSYKFNEEIPDSRFVPPAEVKELIDAEADKAPAP